VRANRRRYLSRLAAPADEHILHLSSNQKIFYVNIQITRRATKSHQAVLVRDVTTGVSVIGKKPEHLQVVIQEISERAGALLAS
jgi:4-oxalocrotonate tautomerase